VDCVVVSVGSEAFAFSLEDVQEIARGCWPGRLPRAPFGCLGAVTVRGQAMALLDLGVLVGARRPARGAELEDRLLDAHLVVLGGREPLALVVDRVLQVSPGAELRGEGATARVSTGGGEALLLRPSDLLGARRRRLVQGALARGTGAA
jgi:hypothetical protein